MESPAETTNQNKQKFRIGHILAWIGLLVFLTVLALGLIRSQQGSISVGSQVPDFSLTKPDGKQLNLADQRGKIVVLNFWASWCKPCEQEAADLEAAWKFYETRGDVVFWGINYVDVEPEAIKYLKKYSISYPNAPDLGTRVSQIFRTRGVPETYFIDRQGKLVYAKIGPFSSIEQIKGIIEPLLGK